MCPPAVACTRPFAVAPLVRARSFLISTGQREDLGWSETTVASQPPQYTRHVTTCSLHIHAMPHAHHSCASPTSHHASHRVRRCPKIGEMMNSPNTRDDRAQCRASDLVRIPRDEPQRWRIVRFSSQVHPLPLLLKGARRVAALILKRLFVGTLHRPGILAAGEGADLLRLSVTPSVGALTPGARASRARRRPPLPQAPTRPARGNAVPARPAQPRCPSPPRRRRR